MRPCQRQLRCASLTPRFLRVRRALLCSAFALTVAGTVAAPAPVALAHPPGPTAPAPAPATVEHLAPYDPQSSCDPAAKPGTKALAATLLGYYGMGRSGGIVRACHIGHRSEHKEGRAWDWMLSISDRAERATAEQFLSWLLAEGPNGEQAYNARRLGVMYVIWNHRIWSAGHADAGWRPYRGPNPHIDHIHISLSWSGALKQTSWWTGVAADVSPPSGQDPADTPEPEPADADEDDESDEDD